MTVTSGQKCSESYANFSPLGSLVKMCLESSVWHSTRCLLLWKQKVTKSNVSLFQLAVSMPRTEEKGVPFWPTPSTGASLCGGSGNFNTLKKMAEKGLITEEERRSLSQGNGGKTNPELVEWLMGYEQQFTKLIPTPTATDYKGGCMSRYWKPDSQTVQVEREREREDSGTERFSDSRISGTRGVKQDSNGLPMYRQQGSITGFPPNTRYNWCQKLKLPQGSIQGFPVLGRPWCQGGLKRVPESRIPSTDLSMVSEAQNRQGQNTFSDERPTRRKDRNIVEYLGIAADEPKRFGQLTERKRAPLAEFGIDEDLCGLYCQYADMLSPTYETSCRDGCWFCHNQGVAQLRNLRKKYPDLWRILLGWDKDSPVTFKADGHTVHDFDRRFQMEDEGYISPDEPFRWKMLDGDLQKRLF